MDEEWELDWVANLSKIESITLFLLSVIVSLLLLLWIGLLLRIKWRVIFFLLTVTLSLFFRYSFVILVSFNSTITINKYSHL